MKDVAYLRSALINAESIYYPNRAKLLDLYSDIELDGHLSGLVQKRISAVLNKDWCFRKGDADVDAVNAFIGSNTFRDIVAEIMLSKFWSVSGLEFIPGPAIAFKNIPRKHIKPETQVIKLHQSDADEGIPYPPLKNVWIISKDKDYGLFLKCAFYALIKKGGFADWAQYVEIFGQPMRIGKYDANDIKTKDQLAGALKDAGGSLAIMIPKQAEFEVLDGKSSNGDGQLQERLKSACNNEMSVAVLGNTETTGNDNGGSNAKAKEQGRQQMEITKDDVIFVRNMLNDVRFLDILQTYALPVQGGKFVVEKEVDVYELQSRSVIDTTLKNAGLPIDDEYFYETYHIPKPANYEKLKAEGEGEKQKAESQKPGAKGKPTIENDEDDDMPGLSAWKRFRIAMSDFFYPAP